MAADIILRSYGDVSAKEDVVLNSIEILTAKEEQIFNLLGKTSAINTIHAYLTDTLRTAASAAVEEAADYVALQNSTPSRLTNIVQKVAIPFKVSRTQQYITHYQGEDELRRQTQKALMDWGNAAEFDLVRSTLVSGASGTVPKMSGIIEATSKSTNHTSHTSGTIFSATILDGLMQLNWNNSNGDVATDLFLGAHGRSVMDQFAQKSNVVVNATLTEINKRVSTYTTSFGTLSLHTHRYLQQSSDATDRILAIRPEKLKLAFLQKPFVDTDLARTGPFDFYAVTGDFTLEVRNQDSAFFADGFLKTG